MSLRHALLTALCERDGSGLELATRFDRSIGHFWSATHQQIYRELSRMEDAGLIRSERVVAARGGKRTYGIVSAGRHELKRWVEGAASELPQFRDGLLVRLRAEAAIGPTGLSEIIELLLVAHRARLGRYRDLQARHFPEESPDRTAALRRVILRSGIRHEENWVATLMDASDALRLPGPAGSI